MTHLFVSTNFNEMNEPSNSEVISSFKVIYGQLPIMRFFKEIRSIIMTFYRLLFTF